MSNPLPLAELINVSKAYQNNGISRKILTDLSFSINKGESVAIVGPSGSGKTTFLNILGLLDLPDIGSVLHCNFDMKSKTRDELADTRNKQIGFVFQLHYLLPQLNLIENILVPLIPEKDKEKRKAARVYALELLEKLGLADKSNQFPGTLSVGECQRAAVVRAIINKPGLVLADEPTGSLDHDSSLKLAGLLSELCKSFSLGLVVVTHSMEIAAKMDKTYRLFNGKLEPV